MRDSKGTSKILPKFLWYLSARWFGAACISLYVNRYTPEGHEQVLLLPRPLNDPYFAGLLHLPGARKNPKETDAETLQRAMEEADLRGAPRYLYSDTYFTARGTEYADIRGVTVDYNPNDGRFYDVDYLPASVIPHHVEIIKRLHE